MAKRRRETPEERAQRDRRERIELLKMKQGLIEESEIIPESGYEKAPEQGAASKVSSFIYRNKIFVVLGVLFTAIAVVLVTQMLLREKPDMTVLVVAYDRNSDMAFYTETIEKALELYCPDFDGNGKVHVLVNFVDRTTRDNFSQYDDLQAQKLNSALQLGEAQLIIADEEIVERVNVEKDKSDSDAMRGYFLDQTDKLSADISEDELYYGVGIRMNTTAFAQKADWDGCPDNVILLIRDETSVKESDIKRHTAYRERAQIVLQNIIDNNIVNPAE